MLFASVITVMRIDIIAMVLSVAVASFLLFGCRDAESDAKAGAAQPSRSATAGGPPSLDGPVPGARLIADGTATEGGIGTRCWANACIDMVGPVTTEAVVELAPGDDFSIDFEEASPKEVHYRWFVAPDVTPAANNGERGWSINPSTGSQSDGASAPSTPGNYVLSVFATWEGKGDISYGWYVEVEE